MRYLNQHTLGLVASKPANQNKTHFRIRTKNEKAPDMYWKLLVSCNRMAREPFSSQDTKNIEIVLWSGSCRPTMIVHLLSMRLTSIVEPMLMTRGQWRLGLECCVQETTDYCLWQSVLVSCYRWAVLYIENVTICSILPAWRHEQYHSSPYWVTLSIHFRGGARGGLGG